MCSSASDLFFLIESVSIFIDKAFDVLPEDYLRSYLKQEWHHLKELLTAPELVPIKCYSYSNNLKLYAPYPQIPVATLSLGEAQKSARQLETMKKDSFGNQISASGNIFLPNSFINMNSAPVKGISLNQKNDQKQNENVSAEKYLNAFDYSQTNLQPSQISSLNSPLLTTPQQINSTQGNIFNPINSRSQINVLPSSERKHYNPNIEEKNNSLENKQKTVSPLGVKVSKVKAKSISQAITYLLPSQQPQHYLKKQGNYKPAHQNIQFQSKSQKSLQLDFKVSSTSRVQNNSNQNNAKFQSEFNTARTNSSQSKNTIDQLSLLLHNTQGFAQNNNPNSYISSQNSNQASLKCKTAQQNINQQPQSGKSTEGNHFNFVNSQVVYTSLNNMPSSVYLQSVQSTIHNHENYTNPNSFYGKQDSNNNSISRGGFDQLSNNGNQVNSNESTLRNFSGMSLNNTNLGSSASNRQSTNNIKQKVSSIGSINCLTQNFKYERQNQHSSRANSNTKAKEIIKIPIDFHIQKTESIKVDEQQEIKNNLLNPPIKYQNSPQFISVKGQDQQYNIEIGEELDFFKKQYKKNEEEQDSNKKGVMQQLLNRLEVDIKQIHREKQRQNSFVSKRLKLDEIAECKSLAMIDDDYDDTPKENPYKELLAKVSQRISQFQMDSMTLNIIEGKLKNIETRLHRDTVDDIKEGFQERILVRRNTLKKYSVFAKKEIEENSKKLDLQINKQQLKEQNLTFTKLNQKNKLLQNNREEKMKVVL